ncbi:phosphatidylcholine/phosphatidylserine synthase [Sphingomonas sp. ASV193]|uniref:CDP-alcohol phosphatidyltransferase family protein n=1 Tax=Sphingomonas sp. ASV193 TaxID=3144405 RepID=UPI0032E904DE
MSEPPVRAFPFRAFVPNAVTAMALCLGLTGIRFGIDHHWDKALLAVVGAGVLDGMDGRIARALRAQSKFGEELDSLSDNIAFGTAPALILFLWSLHAAPRFGWIASLALAVCCALRLARYNSRIDADYQPHKSAGFNTGVPAPAGAGLAFVPILLWLVTDNALFEDWRIVLPWTLFVAVLMISAIPTFSWSSIRIRQQWRMIALLLVVLLGASLVVAPFQALLVVTLGYLATIPWSLASYAAVRRRRATPPRRAADGEPTLPEAGSAR